MHPLCCWESQQPFPFTPKTSPPPGGAFGGGSRRLFSPLSVQLLVSEIYVIPCPISLSQAERLEEAVDLVKALARRHQTAAGQQQRSGRPASPGPSGAAGSGGGGAPGGGGLQEHTLNSLIRALCGKYVDRALRLLSLCQVR